MKQAPAWIYYATMTTATKVNLWTILGAAMAVVMKPTLYIAYTHDIKAGERL
jgi:hypothetical protein